MLKQNPFDAHEVASKYEVWYHTLGQKAAISEKKLLKQFLGNFSAAQSVLEIGCGTGYFTEWFRTSGYNVLGLDRSLIMLQEGQKRHPFPCVNGDAMFLPFQDNSFDLVVMITALEFVSHPEKVVEEAWRVARQGLILGVINRHSLLGWQYRMMDGPVWEIATFFTPGELVRLLRRITKQNTKIYCRTTLWPLFRGSSPLPWGGFIGLAVINLDQTGEQ